MQRCLLVLCVSLLLVFGAAANAITFTDGLPHVIDASNSFPAEPVLVYNGPGATSTSVALTTGGEIGTLTRDRLIAYEHSVITMTDGEIGDLLELYDSASATVSGGSMQYLLMWDSSTACVTGGLFTTGILARGNSLLEFSGGQVDGKLYTSEFLSESPDVRIQGGWILSDVSIGGRGNAVITGGTWNGLLLAQQEAVITIIGSAFNLPLGPVSSTGGVLSGVLADGTSFSTDFGRASTATITLIPEPSTALLLACGLAGLAAAGRRRQ